jgi:hypothetical protein
MKLLTATEILRDKKIRGKHDKVEADKKEDCRWQRLPHLVQKPRADPTRNPGTHADWLGRTGVFISDRRCPHRLALYDGSHWLAGMVTTGADPLTPVSAIENSSMIIPNVYLDWTSVSAIQNHLLSYCTATWACWAAHP